MEGAVAFSRLGDRTLKLERVILAVNHFLDVFINFFLEVLITFFLLFKLPGESVKKIL